MKRICKIQLEIIDEQIISLPDYSEILSVQVRNNIPCLWYLFDENENDQVRMKNRIICIYCTGNSIDNINEHDELDFIDTIQMHNGSLVFHIFEKVT